MKSLVILSFDRPDHRARARLVDRARRALQALGGRPPEVDVAGDRDHLLVDRRSRDDVVDWPERISVGLSRGAWTTGGHRVHTAEHLDASFDPRWPSSIVPPFGILVRRHRAGPFVATTDTCGLRHLHLFEGNGWVGCSTSSLILAATAGASLDARAVTTAALVGHQLGDDTPFEGVRRLPAAHRFEMESGRARRIPFGSAQRSDGPETRPQSDGRPEAVEEGADVMTRSVGAALDAHPDVGLELSGGLDSRMLLAAIPEDRRVGRWALTLTAPGNPDCAVACRLAAASSLDHEVVDLSELERLAPDEALDVVRRAALRRDATIDPVAGAVLDWAALRTEGRAVLTGQNGEFARGYYYPGQPSWPQATTALVRHLARWRVLTAAPVDGALFGDLLPGTVRRTTEVLEERIRRIGGRWPEVTDELYLAVRMQNWVGRDFSVAATERLVIAPFFHPAFLSWARRAPRKDKAGSRLFAAVLERLDPRLASMELDTGTKPVTLAHPSLRSQAETVGRLGRKTMHKIGLRIAPGKGAAPPAGAAALAASVQRAWAADESALSRLGSLDFVDAGVVEAVAAGRRAASPATIGFLAALDAALEVLEGTSA